MPLIFDAEIIGAIRDKKRPPIEGIRYAQGWRDYGGMGVSCVCTYDVDYAKYQVYCQDNFGDLQLAFDEADFIVGYNSVGFDVPLLVAAELNLAGIAHYDILAAIWTAHGLTSTFQFPSHLGFSLDNMLQANFPGFKKSGDGAMAPVWWQQGKFGKVISYCLDDVRLTKMLFDKILHYGTLMSPKTGMEVPIKSPLAVVHNMPELDQAQAAQEPEEVPERKPGGGAYMVPEDPD